MTKSGPSFIEIFQAVKFNLYLASAIDIPERADFVYNFV